MNYSDNITKKNILFLIILILVIFDQLFDFPTFLKNFLFFAVIVSIALLFKIDFFENKKFKISYFQNKLLENSYDSSVSAYIFLDKNLKCVFKNDYANRMFGINSKNFNDILEKFSSKKDLKEIFLQVRQNILDRKNCCYDVDVKNENFEVIIWRIRVSQIKDLKNYSVLSISDITPGKIYLGEIQNDQTFLKNIFNSLPVPAIVTDSTSSKILFFNNKFHDIFESEEEFLKVENRYLINLFNPSEKFKSPLNHFEVKILTNNPKDAVVQKIFSSQAGNVFLIKTGNEDMDTITIVQKYQLFIKYLFEDSPVNIAIITKNKKIVLSNKTFKKTIVAGNSEYNQIDDNKLISDYIDETSLNCFNKNFDMSMQNNSSLNGSFEISMKNGETYLTYFSNLNRNIDFLKGDLSVIENNARVNFANNNKMNDFSSYTKNYYYTENSNFHDDQFNFEHLKENSIDHENLIERNEDLNEDDENKFLILYLLDISDFKRYKNQLYQSQKTQAIGQLAGGIAHDFNNILTAIIGYSDLLLAKHSPVDSSFNDLMQIKQNSTRASNLIRQLLAFSRQQKMQPKILDLSDNINEIILLIERLIGTQIELKVLNGRDLRLIKMDPIQFEQIIINLSVNARDAMKKGGTLTIESYNLDLQNPMITKNYTVPSGKYVVVKISDTGIGISEENIGKIFDPFFSTKEKGEGTGLGLATVFGIVKQIEGHIICNSKIGVGTEFLVFFPVCDEISNSENMIQESKSGNLLSSISQDLTGGGKILLVEDEFAIRSFAKKALEAKGYSIIDAESGYEALKLIENLKTNIDLVITDLVMPKMDGADFVHKLREIIPNIKVIFISGYAEDSIKNNIELNNFTFFLPKPFTLKDLAAKVKEVM